MAPAEATPRPPRPPRPPAPPGPGGTLAGAALVLSAGALLAEDIECAPRAAQRRKSVDALARADGDAAVVLAVARLFAAEKKPDKARKWFSRACSLDADFGDALAAFYAFEQEQQAGGEALSALEAKLAAAGAQQ